MSDFWHAFKPDFKAGKLFWSHPPRNHVHRTCSEAGYINAGKGKNKSYWQIRVDGKTFKRSRVIFFMAHGKWPEPCVDHINGDSLDDRIENLRECNFSQNIVNSKPKLKIKQLPVGVYETKQGKYMARVTVNGNTNNLGTFPTIGEANRIAKKFRKGVYGEFATK